MDSPFDANDDDYRVLVNAEGQYSLWPAFREIPRGWNVTGPAGARQSCLDWIEAHWSDLRPASLQPPVPSATQ